MPLLKYSTLKSEKELNFTKGKKSQKCVEILILLRLHPIGISNKLKQQAKFTNNFFIFFLIYIQNRRELSFVINRSLLPYVRVFALTTKISSFKISSQSTLSETHLLQIKFFGSVIHAPEYLILNGIREVCSLIYY